MPPKKRSTSKKQQEEQQQVVVEQQQQQQDDVPPPAAAAATASSPSPSKKQQQPSQEEQKNNNNEHLNKRIYALEVGVCNDISATSKVDPIICADVFRNSDDNNNDQQQPSLIIVAHESGKLTQYVMVDSSPVQTHITPMCWTGGRSDLVFTRVRYFKWNSSLLVASSSSSASPSASKQDQQHHHPSVLCIAAATRAGQILLFTADTLHLIGTVQSGGGSIQDLSEVIQFSAQDKCSFFAACADGNVRRFTAATDEYGLRTAASSSLFNTTSSSASSSEGDKDSSLFSALSLEIDQQFSRHEKASLALAVSASAKAGLVCFTDDVGNITAYRIQEDRKKKDFGWMLQLPTGVGMRACVIDSSANHTVVVGTSVNEVVFIDSVLGVFGQRFRNHQGPVTALCASFNNNTLNKAAAATVHASGWHDLIRAYACPAHRIANNNNNNTDSSLAYDFAPAEAKRQTHYHEVVEMFTSRGVLLSFSKDGTIMQIPINALNQPNKANYTDTVNNKTAPMAMKGPVVCFFDDSSFEVQFYAIRPSNVTPLGVLQLRGPWRVRSLTLSNDLSHLAVTTDVGVTIYKININLATNRIAMMKRYYTSFLSTERLLKVQLKTKMSEEIRQELIEKHMLHDNYEIPEATSVTFSSNACYISSGRYIYRVRLVHHSLSKEEKTTYRKKAKMAGKRRGRDEDSENTKEEEQLEKEKRSDLRRQLVSRHTVSKRISFLTVFGSSSQKSLFIVYVDGTSQVLLLNSETEEINSPEEIMTRISQHQQSQQQNEKRLPASHVLFTLARHAKKSLTVRDGPRGIFTCPSIPSQPNGEDTTLLCYSVEARSHLSIRAPSVEGEFFLPAKPISSQAPATFEFEAQLPGDQSIERKVFLAMSASGLQMVDTAHSSGRFKQLGSSSSYTNNSQNNNSELRVRPSNAQFLYPHSWKLGQQEKKKSEKNDNEDTKLTEEERKERIAAQALSSVAVATVGDLANSTSLLNDLKQEKMSRAAKMQKKPSVFVFERNLEKMISSLPEQWRVRKFGN